MSHILFIDFFLGLFVIRRNSSVVVQNTECFPSVTAADDVSSFFYQDSYIFFLRTCIVVEVKSRP